MKVSYLIRSITDKPTKIYGRFRIPKGKQVKFFTGLFVSKKDWSETKGSAYPRTPELKRLNNSLEQIASKIVDGFNNYSYDVQRTIRYATNDAENLEPSVLEYLAEKIETADNRIVGSRRGLAKGTIKNYKVFHRQLLQYQQYSKSEELRFSEVDQKLANRLIDFMLNVKGFSENTMGRQLGRLKTLCREAEMDGIRVNPKAKGIQKFSQKQEDRIIHTLEDSEIEAVKELIGLPPYLFNVRKLFLIGIYTGLRVSDLRSINTSAIRVVGESVIIDIIQKKTKRPVSIPVIDEYVKNILLNEFPRVISNQNFNDYIKELCKRAGIVEVVKGNKRVDGRYQRIQLPKYQFLSSHSCRRTFCSKFYSIVPMEILMAISGHAKEESFLRYINKTRDKDFFANEFVKRVNEAKTKD